MKDSEKPTDSKVGDEEDKFLVWEPLTKYEKMECISSNLFEVNYLVFIGIVSMVYQCFQSGLLFVFSYLFLTVTSKELRQRCELGIKFLIVRTVVFIVLFIIKLIYLSSIYSFKSDSKTTYTNELNFYMFMGFYFNSSE